MQNEPVKIICSYLHISECKWHNRHGFKCQYHNCQEKCPNFSGNYEYHYQLWLRNIQIIAEQSFPYETEETCPNALARSIKNQYIDAARAGFIKGYIHASEDYQPPCA